jgi:hypothetical protein
MGLEQPLSLQVGWLHHRAWNSCETHQARSAGKEARFIEALLLEMVQVARRCVMRGCLAKLIAVAFCQAARDFVVHFCGQEPPTQILHRSPATAPYLVCLPLN